MIRIAWTLLLLLTAASAFPLQKKSLKETPKGQTREYFIAAEDVGWDFAPSGRDLMYNRAVPEPYLQTKYPKTRYIEYTDSKFNVKKPQPEWLGILGPIIRAEVGDTVVVHFLNRSHRQLSIHPHGLKYTKENEGATYSVTTGRPASGVPPDQDVTYTWFADEGSGPGRDQPSSIVWPYHSHVEETQEVNDGLIGAIIVTAKGKARPDGSPRDVDQEFVVLMMVFDQQMGKEAGMMHAVNGYIFANLTGLVVNQGSKVRWHLFSMGNERDIHTAHWHGGTVFTAATHEDVVPLVPAISKSVDMKADNPGSWMFHCHVADHMEGGMMVFFSVLPPPNPCPVKFGAGEFWKDPRTVQFAVSNASGKPIKHIEFTANVFLKPNYLTPTLVIWKSDTTLAVGGTGAYKFPIYMHDPGQIPGWAIYVTEIEYQDGSRWLPKAVPDCVHVYRRDGSTEQPRVLPPVQTPNVDD
ncbi:MAG TPA: multicopper oxidase domain-containing protein [Candidatus Sulfotelmatobacter sp.]|nr:multicopper oxidase domain-containing protein [Candidatus Sulfotelmatobacter sp.]